MYILPTLTNSAHLRRASTREMCVAKSGKQVWFASRERERIPRLHAGPLIVAPTKAAPRSHRRSSRRRPHGGYFPPFVRLARRRSNRCRALHASLTLACSSPPSIASADAKRLYSPVGVRPPPNCDKSVMATRQPCAWTPVAPLRRAISSGCPIEKLMAGLALFISVKLRRAGGH
jgi:hypothetical protein